MTEPKIISLPNTDINLTDLKLKFGSMSERSQLQLLPELINAGEEGLEVLMEFLLLSRAAAPNWMSGKIYQTLYKIDSPAVAKFIQKEFPQGIVPLNSERNIDYLPLQEQLLNQNFQTADSLTLQKLCELAGDTAIQRKWLYFTEVENFPTTDLQTINNLWLVHSEGKFSFSVQRELWLGTGKNFVKLWDKIGWKKGNNWTRYPHEFTWDLSAPKGHLPLSNQLRGVRVIAALFAHPVWNS